MLGGGEDVVILKNIQEKNVIWSKKSILQNFKCVWNTGMQPILMYDFIKAPTKIATHESFLYTQIT